MNERINDLMNEAMPTIDWKARHGVELNNGERMKWYAEWFENFAELIVLESIEYCGENLPKTVGGALKIHFGVEDE